ncbi:MAG: metalloregulator ArsR/SmtB family transcription factor [Halomonas sp.]|nr:metalloregulator ArsR/SmtB family transcription factor [Halomonas sp.]
MLTPVRFFKCLGDDTRLALVLLVHVEGELCVCEMSHALQVSQPKVSRHLALLRDCGLLLDRRQGQWVHYRLAPELPGWVIRTLDAAVAGASAQVGPLRQRLAAMGDRPGRQALACK